MQEKVELVPVYIEDQVDLYIRADRASDRVIETAVRDSLNHGGTLVEHPERLRDGLYEMSRLMALAVRPDVPRGSSLTRHNPSLPDTVFMGKNIARAVEYYPQLFSQCMGKLPAALNSALFKPATPPVGM